MRCFPQGLHCERAIKPADHISFVVGAVVLVLDRHGPIPRQDHGHADALGLGAGCARPDCGLVA